MPLVVVSWWGGGGGGGGTEGHVLTLSVNLVCDSKLNGDTVHVIIDLEVVALGSIVGHEESVADVNGVSDSCVQRERVCGQRS